LIKVPVIDVQPLGVRTFTAGTDLSVIVAFVFRDCVGEFSGWVNIPEEDVDDGVAAFLAESACVEDGLEVDISYYGRGTG
jgi:hypothetical protein